MLVTGASGFLGANLVRALMDQGASVSATVRPSTNLWRLKPELAGLHFEAVDHGNPEAAGPVLERLRPEIVFHLAFPPGHPEEAAARANMLRVGLLGLSALLEAAARVGVSRFVQIGSSLEYGSQDHPARENDPLRPGTFRGAVKAASSLLCRQFAREPGIPIVILRVFHAYGPWEARSRLIPAALLAAMNGDSLPLTPPGLRHDFVYVADVVDACLKAATLEAKDCTEINIGYGQTWTNEAVVELVQTIVGREIRLLGQVLPARPADLDRRQADTSQAREVLGWSPRYPIRSGLEETYAWLKSNLGRYDRQGAKSAER